MCVCETVSWCLNWYQMQKISKITTSPPPQKSTGTHFFFLHCCTPFHFIIFFYKDLCADQNYDWLLGLNYLDNKVIHVGMKAALKHILQKNTLPELVKVSMDWKTASSNWIMKIRAGLSVYLKLLITVGFLKILSGCKYYTY